MRLLEGLESRPLIAQVRLNLFRVLKNISDHAIDFREGANGRVGSKDIPGRSSALKGIDHDI